LSQKNANIFAQDIRILDPGKILETSLNIIAALKDMNETCPRNIYQKKH
jgi:hypothetical protein